MRRLARVLLLNIMMMPMIFPVDLAASTAAAASDAADSSSSLKGNRILIVTSDGRPDSQLARILAELYKAKVTVTRAEDYSPLIDEYAYNGFVYYGAAYKQMPKQGFLDDMQRTKKPILWINYHAWLLSKAFFKKKHLVIYDVHGKLFNKLVFNESTKLTPTDTTLVKAGGALVMYWLYGPGGKSVPGAVHSGNFTYISYSPNLDMFAPDFLPFLAAVRAAFGHTIPPKKPETPSYPKRIEHARADDYRTGIHLPVYVARTSGGRAGYDSDQWHANLMRIKNAGAEWVNVVRTYYQKDISASRIYADPKLTPTLGSLKNIIEDAHKIGLLVRLHIAINLVERKPNEWHGMIRPKNRRQWWDNFKSLALELAEFSKHNEVESLMLGTEFSTMQSDARDWRDLFNLVRNHVKYVGLIGYGVNYNVLDIEWLEALDFFSISAYWPLSKDRDPDIETLNKSWKKIGRKLKAWKRAHPKISLEFGEIGYVSQPYASTSPFSWKAYKGKAQSLSEQLQCYRALHHFLANNRDIGGIHVFASTEEDTEPGSRGYTPFGKPAERVVEKILRLR